MDKLNVSMQMSVEPVDAQSPEWEADFAEEPEDGVREIFEFLGIVGFGKDGARSPAIHMGELS